MQGTISVTGHNQVRLTLPQKYRAICDALQRKYGGTVGFAKGYFKWRIGEQLEVQAFLKAILPHSIEKAEQIKLAIDMPVNGAQALRAALKPMKGNQGKAKDVLVAAPQKRLHGLPRYIGELYNSKKELVGYKVQFKGTNRKFGNTKEKMEDKLEKAIACKDALVAAHKAKVKQSAGEQSGSRDDPSDEADSSDASHISEEISSSSSEATE